MYTYQYGKELRLCHQLHMFFAYTGVSAFVSLDKTCSWESRESCGTYLFRFQKFESGVHDHGSQILHATSTGVKARSLALAFLLGLEIGNHQSSTGFEHTGDFRESLSFEG